MARSYAALPHEYLEEMELLTDAEFGRLCRALLVYSSTGKESDLSGAERYQWKRVQMQEDRFQKFYSETSEVLSEAGKRGAEKRWGNAKNKNPIGANSPHMAPNGQNGKSKSKSKSNNRRLSSSSLSDDDDEKISRISDCFSRNMGKNPQIVKRESEKFLSSGLSEDLICRAIEDAAAHDARSWAYVSKILQQCEAQKIFTAEDFEKRVPAGIAGSVKKEVIKGLRKAPKFTKAGDANG